MLDYIVAAFVLAIIPGPGVAFVLAQTIGFGRAAGFASIAGVAAGNFLNATGASIGLAAIFELSGHMFWIARLVGAGYMFWLGIQSLALARHDDKVGVVARMSLKKRFADGFFVSLLNPKTALFFAALLPQFVNPNENMLEMGVLHGGVFVLIAVATDSVYVLLASLMAQTLRKRVAAHVAAFASGVSFLVLGLYALLIGNGRRA